MVAVRRTRRLSPGRRNLLERLARSRAARDLRRARREFVRGLLLGVWLLGWCGVLGWLVDRAAPLVARWLGWM